MPAPDHVEQIVFVISSRRFAPSVAFYADVLGLELIEEWTEQGTSSDATFIGLQVTEVDPVYARARAGGHEIVREPAERPWGGRGFVVRDPNGIAINVYTDYGR